MVSDGSGVGGGDDERAGVEMRDAFALAGSECVSDGGSCVVGAFGSVQEALGDQGTEPDDDVGDGSCVSCPVATSRTMSSASASPSGSPRPGWPSACYATRTSA
jgi:hypothetical protein